MTLPVTASAHTHHGPVQLAISQELLLEILRLPRGTEIVGAAAEHWAGPKLVLYLQIPGAPEGADQVVPQYERDTAVPDPVRLTELQWLRGGHWAGVTDMAGADGR